MFACLEIRSSSRHLSSVASLLACIITRLHVGPPAHVRDEARMANESAFLSTDSSSRALMLITPNQHFLLNMVILQASLQPKSLPVEKSGGIDFASV